MHLGKKQEACKESSKLSSEVNRVLLGRTQRGRRPGQGLEEGKKNLRVLKGHETGGGRWEERGPPEHFGKRGVLMQDERRGCRSGAGGKAGLGIGRDVWLRGSLKIFWSLRSWEMLLSARRVCLCAGNNHLGRLQQKYPHFGSRLGCHHLVLISPAPGAPRRVQLEGFGAREAVPWQKPLQRADAAQRGWKGRSFPGSRRRPCRICCQPGKQSKVDGVRLNLKARTCPARTVRFVTSPFHHSPVLFCLFSGLINSWD